MALKPAICTQCGGRIEVDDSKEAGICPSCGTAFITEKVITQYVTQNNFAGATINIQGGVDTDNLYTLARRAVQTNNGEDALKYYEMINQRNPNDWESSFYTAWYKGGDAFTTGIIIAIGLLDKSDVDNKNEHYLEIGKRIVNSGRFEVSGLCELTVFLTSKNGQLHSDFVNYLLDSLMQIVKNQGYYANLYSCLKAFTWYKDPIFKDHIECCLEEAMNKISNSNSEIVQHELEEVILSCDLIDKDKWLKELYTRLFLESNLTDSQYKELKQKLEKIDPSIIKLRKRKTNEALDREVKSKKIMKKIPIVILLLVPVRLIPFFLWDNHPIITVLLLIFYVPVAVGCSLDVLFPR